MFLERSIHGATTSNWVRLHEIHAKSCLKEHEQPVPHRPRKFLLIRRRLVLGMVSLAVAFLLILPSGELPSPTLPARPSVFDLPEILAKAQRLRATASEHLRQGRYGPAETCSRQLIQLLPQDHSGSFFLACALARQGKLDEAVAALERALHLGYNDARTLAADPNLAALRKRDDFQKILARTPSARPDPQVGWHFTVTPALVQEGKALVTDKNTFWDPRLGPFRTTFQFPEKTDKPIAGGSGTADQLLLAWEREGTAAGNHGDLYDNHDDHHSLLNLARFPQLTSLEFGEAARAHGFHYGLQRWFVHGAPTLGNSSTALVRGPNWRSQPRLALTQVHGALTLFQQYIHNQLYVYPSVRDYDSGSEGDVYPANTPYVIISHGVSGSDQVFLEAVAATMAAFRPEVKAELVRQGLLMPTVQMILRASNRLIKKPDDYLTGLAHPTVFEGLWVDPVRMVKMAHEMTVEVLPPLVHLQVLEEDPLVLGVDDCDEHDREKLFDTPCAIARVVRSLKYERRMIVSAEKSRDPKGKPLTYRWVVLRGQAGRIKIRTLNAAGSVAELRIPYHWRRRVEGEKDLESNRVDIGVFVSNDKYTSAPGFLSLFYLNNERRSYDARGRIQEVDYVPSLGSRNYVDPVLSVKRDWRDEFRYDAAGQCQGWVRIRADGRERFTSDGQLVTRVDGKDRPVEFKKVRYRALALPEQSPLIVEEALDR